MKITTTGAKAMRLDSYTLILSSSITLQDIQELFSEQTTLSIIVGEHPKASCKLRHNIQAVDPKLQVNGFWLSPFPTREFRINLAPIVVPPHTSFRVHMEPNYTRLLNADAIRIQVDGTPVEEPEPHPEPEPGPHTSYHYIGDAEVMNG